MKDSEDKKLPDDPEIGPEMYMFFNKILSENAPDKKEEPESEISPDDDDCEVLYADNSDVMGDQLESVNHKLSEILKSVRRDKEDTDERIARLEKRIDRLKYSVGSAADNSETDSRIAVLTKLVSEMISMMKNYTGMMKAYTGANA